MAATLGARIDSRILHMICCNHSNSVSASFLNILNSDPWSVIMFNSLMKQ